MKIMKLTAAALAMAMTFAAAASNAQATTINFNEGRTSLNDGTGANSTTVSTNAAADTVIDGTAQFDLTNIRYWWRGRDGQSGADAQTEQANSWNFTLSHAGTTADLGGLPGATGNYWFMTDVFDGITAAGDWILTATSDYYAADKQMIAFDLAGFFNTAAAPAPDAGVAGGGAAGGGAGGAGGGAGGAGGGGAAGGGAGGGQVPVPATLFLILAGFAGMAGARRKA